MVEVETHILHASENFLFALVESVAIAKSVEGTLAYTQIHYPKLQRRIDEVGELWVSVWLNPALSPPMTTTTLKNPTRNGGGDQASTKRNHQINLATIKLRIAFGQAVAFLRNPAL